MVIKPKVVWAISIVLIFGVAFILNLRMVAEIKEIKIMTEKIIKAEYQNDMAFIRKNANTDSIDDWSLFNMSHLKLQSIDKIEVEIQNNTAVVTATISSSDHDGYVDQYYEGIQLIKIDDIWKISSVIRDT